MHVHSFQILSFHVTFCKVRLYPAHQHPYHCSLCVVGVAELKFKTRSVWVCLRNWWQDGARVHAIDRCILERRVRQLVSNSVWVQRDSSGGLQKQYCHVCIKVHLKFSTWSPSVLIKPVCLRPDWTITNGRTSSLTSWTGIVATTRRGSPVSRLVAWWQSWLVWRSREGES